MTYRLLNAIGIVLIMLLMPGCEKFSLPTPPNPPDLGSTPWEKLVIEFSDKATFVTGNTPSYSRLEIVDPVVLDALRQEYQPTRLSHLYSSIEALAGQIEIYTLNYEKPWVIEFSSASRGAMHPLGTHDPAIAVEFPDDKFAHAVRDMLRSIEGQTAQFFIDY